MTRTVLLAGVSAATALLLLLLTQDSHAFMPVPIFHARVGSTTLFAARRSASAGSNRKGGGGGGARPSKKSNPKKRDNQGSARTGKKNPMAASSSSSVQQRQQHFEAAGAADATAKPSGGVTPPWQIVSKKDRKRNLEVEKQRRKLAQSGVHVVDAMQQEEEFTLSRSFLDPADKAILAWKRFSPQQQQLQIEFVGAYLDKRLPPRLGVPEVAFLGRSNVGKSSLLNRLVSSDAARVGKTPGATASVNLYGLYQKEKPLLGLVDLPGFGYAKLSKESKESVQMAAEHYLGRRKELFLGILLVDIRREPSDDDRAVLAALFDMGHPIVVVATKLDKLSKDKARASLEVIRDRLGLPEGQPLCVSSVTGDGIRDLWTIIVEACEIGVEDYHDRLLRTKNDDDVFIEQSIHSPDDQDDDDDIAYDQGFDWIHGADGNVMYEDDGDYEWGEEEEDDFHDNTNNINDGPDETPEKETMKFLRKKARDLERRNLV